MKVSRQEKIIIKDFIMCIRTIRRKTIQRIEHGTRIERWKRSLYEIFNRQLSKETHYLGRHDKVVRIVLKLVLMKLLVM